MNTKLARKAAAAFILSILALALTIMPVSAHTNTLVSAQSSHHTNANIHVLNVKAPKGVAVPLSSCYWANYESDLETDNGYTWESVNLQLLINSSTAVYCGQARAQSCIYYPAHSGILTLILYVEFYINGNWKNTTQANFPAINVNGGGPLCAATPGFSVGLRNTIMNVSAAHDQAQDNLAGNPNIHYYLCC